MVRPLLYNKEKERNGNGTEQRKDMLDVREKV